MNQNPRTDPQAGGESATPPFALHELLDRCMGSAAVATLLLDKFETQLIADIRMIRDRLDAGDSQQIARTAHALRGAAGALAASLLMDLATGIETLSKANQIESVAREFTSLEAEVARCLAFLPAARARIALGNDCGSLPSGAT